MSVSKHSYYFLLRIDEYKSASIDGKQWILKLEAKEREKSGIKNLKIGYTKVFGYYIEITKSFLNQVPEEFPAMLGPVIIATRLFVISKDFRLRGLWQNILQKRLGVRLCLRRIIMNWCNWKKK